MDSRILSITRIATGMLFFEHGAEKIWAFAGGQIDHKFLTLHGFAGPLEVIGGTLITLGLLADPANFAPGFTSLLLTLQKVPEVFAEAFRPHRFSVARSADCLICQARPTPTSAEELDVALDQALARLGDA